MTQNLVEKWQRWAREIAFNSDFDATHEGVDYGFCMTYQDLDKLVSQIIADTERVGVESGYHLAIKHLSGAINNNPQTAAAEALEWLEDNARLLTPPPQEIKVLDKKEV